jgi:hypothetical protein
MDLIAPGEECQGVSLDVEGQAARGLDVCQAADANEVSASAVFWGHDRFSLPPEAMVADSKWIRGWTSPGTRRESLNEPTTGASPTMDMTSAIPIRELPIRLAVRPITAPSRLPRRNETGALPGGRRRAA